MKKNKSEITVTATNKLSSKELKKEVSQEKLLETSQINDNSFNQSLVHSLSQSQGFKEPEKPKKFKYLNQRVQIPTIYYERVEFIKTIFNNEELGYIVAYAPSPKLSSTKELGKYFKSNLKTIVEIAGGIIFYLYKTITVNKNLFEKSIKGNSSKMLGDILDNIKRTPDEILHSVVINSSEEFLNLYQEICGYGGVRVDVVSGLIKRRDYKCGDSLLKHKWCIMKCGIEKNYLLDPLLTIGEINEKNEFIKEFKPFYFLTPPLFFLENHLPNEPQYQLTQKKIKVKEFTRRKVYFTENYYNGIFKYNITLVKRTSPFFDCKDSETTLSFIVENYDVEMELILNGQKLPESNIIIAESEVKTNYTVTLIFPSNGAYKLKIIGKKKHTITDEICELFSYHINVKITNFISHEPKKKTIKRKIPIPNFKTLNPVFQKKARDKSEKTLSKCASDFGEKIKNKCYDNNNSYVFEPRNKILRIGQDAKFRVRVKNAKVVVVLDGRKWNYLKRKEDDIFEGVIPIKSENIVVCALRNNNIYTEVFEFLAIKK